MVSIRDLFEGVLSDLLCFLSAARVGDGRTPKELGKLLRCGMIGLDDPQILESKWKEIQGLQVEFHLVRHPRATGKMYLYIYNIYMVINQRNGHKHYIVFLDTMRTIFNGHQIHDSYEPSFIHHDSLEVHD